LRVNGSRAPRLTPDLPLYLSCTIQNPHRDRKLELQGLAGLRPVVHRRPKGDVVAARWSSPALKDLTLEPGRGLRLYWILQQSLAPGSYLVSLEGGQKLVDKDAAGVSQVRLKPVYLEVVAGRADPREVARLQRYILALQGKREAYLEAVRRALAVRPQNTTLRWELVQALELNQRPAEAHRELTALIAQVQRRDPSRPPAVPYWCLAKLRELAAKAEGHQPKP
jgi:hypothetical protein